MAAAPAVMIDIARCESGTQQFTADGSVIKDSVYGTHYGLFQISKGWIPTAQKNGWDIFTPQGNIAMALYLYKNYGTQPWNASRFCWSKGGSDG